METIGIGWVDLQVVIHELAILAGVGAVVFAAAQVRQMQKVREAESLLKVLEMSFTALGSNPVATFRRNFHMQQVFTTYEEFVRCEDGQDAGQIGKLIWYYVFLGVTLRQRLLPEEALMRWHAPAIIRTWISVLPIIEGMRQETNSPGFARHFEYLAVRAADWLRHHQASESKFFADIQNDAVNLASDREHLSFDATVYRKRSQR